LFDFLLEPELFVKDKFSLPLSNQSSLKSLPGLVRSRVVESVVLARVARAEVPLSEWASPGLVLDCALEGLSLLAV